jgi:protein phosphatase
MQIKAFGLSDVGKKKSNNEDHFSIVSPEFDDFPYFLAVSDGVGGRNAGELASAVALQFIIGYLVPRSFRNTFNENQINQAFDLANKHLRQESASNSNFRGMGTTVVMALIYSDKTYIASVGDSRAYFINSTIKQITEDHTLPNELFKKGSITQKQYNEHPYKHHLTRAMGIDAAVIPDVFVFNTSDYKTIVLCTDGLTEHVTDCEIFATITKLNNPETSAKKLVQTTLQRGASDNVTVVIADIVS